MDDYLKNIYFAYDLVHSVLLRRSVPWQPMKETAQYKSKIQGISFDEEIGRTVAMFVDLAEDEVVDVFIKLKEFSDDAIEKFSALALGSLPCHFPKGYDTEDFLFFCALMCGVGAYLVTAKDRVYGDLVSETISSVLTTFTLTTEFQEKGGFQGLSEYSGKFLRRCHERSKATNA